MTRAGVGAASPGHFSRPDTNTNHSNDIAMSHSHSAIRAAVWTCWVGVPNYSPSVGSLQEPVGTSLTHIHSDTVQRRRGVSFIKLTRSFGTTTS